MTLVRQLVISPPLSYRHLTNPFAFRKSQILLSADLPQDYGCSLSCGTSKLYSSHLLGDHLPPARLAERAGRFAFLHVVDDVLGPPFDEQWHRETSPQIVQSLSGVTTVPARRVRFAAPPRSALA